MAPWRGEYEIVLGIVGRLVGVVTFAGQFLAVFWVWHAFPYYAERFESDGLENWLLAFLAIVPMAGLAVFAEEGLGATYVGFALAYLVARAVNQVGWARAGLHGPVFRPVAARFLGGGAVVTAVILASFVATGTTRVALFTVAVVLDIAAPLAVPTLGATARTGNQTACAADSQRRPTSGRHCSARRPVASASSAY